MTVYCMCKITGPGQYQMGKVLDNQLFLAQNRMIPPAKGEDYFSVYLGQPMDLVKGGVTRRVPAGTTVEFPNKHPKSTKKKIADQEDIRQKTKAGYRPVKLYHCPRCGAMMCEGE